MTNFELPVLSLVSGTPGVDAIYAWANLGASDTLVQVPVKSLWPAQGLVVATAAGTPFGLALPVDTVLGRLSGNIKAMTRSDLLTLLQVIETSAGAPDAGKLVKLAADGKLDASLIPPAGGSGEANDGTNLGASGARVFAQKNGVILEFRRLRALSTNALQAVETTNSIDFSVLFSDGLAGAADRLWSSLKVETELAAKLANLIEDLSPQLGGDLDIGALSIVSGAVELLRYDSGAGKLYLGGGEVLLPNIVNPQVGEFLGWDGAEWVNAVIAASQVAVTPVGGISASDVQAALAELDTEKSAVGHVHAVFATLTDGFVPGPSAADVTANRLLQADGSWVDPPAGGGGEANDGANVGTAGVGIYRDKTGTTINLKKINSQSGRVVVTDDVANDEVDLELAADAVDDTRLANMPDGTVKGRALGAGTGDPSNLTPTQLRTLLNVENGAKDDQVASEVPVTPVGGIGSTNVQSAIAELDAEKAPTGHTHAQFSQDTDGMVPGPTSADIGGDRHLRADGSWIDLVASIVGLTPTGGISATDVQAAIAELDSEKITALLEDATPELAADLDMAGFDLADAGRKLLAFVANASAVNSLQVENAATGSAPRLSVQGADANIKLVLRSKGTSGIEFQDSLGNLIVKLVRAANAVNYLELQNSPNTISPSIRANGSDADLDILLVPKGNGKAKVGTDPVVTEAATQTLTNKSISASQIDSGTLADARVPQSAVTQYARVCSVYGPPIAQPLGGGFVTVNINTTEKNQGGFTVGANEVTVPEDGTYEITAKVAWEKSDGGIGEGDLKVQEKLGAAAYADVPATNTPGGIPGTKRGSACVTCTRTLSAGDKIRVQTDANSTTISAEVNGYRLLLKKLY